MSSSQVQSPSRSQGAIVRAPSPSWRKSKHTRSVSSNTSNKSLRLTAVIPDSIPMSPLPTRLSVLNDDTDIQIAERQSWWKRLTVNSKRVTDMMEGRENEDKAAEEFDVEILSQEKESMSLNSPESSDGESIHSIVLLQRELFKNRDNRPKKKLKEIINRKDSSGKMPKSFFEQTNIDKDINVMPKKLFNRAPKPETKSVFNAELFNASPNKTGNVKNSIEKPAQEVEGPFRNIFGYRPSIKRKNIFAEFVSSDSDDEFSEIQPRIFGLRTKKNHQEASKQKRSPVYSSASNTTDVEIGEWNHLPSSTMAQHQFEEASGTTPTRRLSKSRKSKAALNKNNSLSTSRRSSQVKYNSKIRPEFEEKNINTRSQSFNKSKNNSQVKPKSINSYVDTNKTNSVRKSSQKNSSKLTHKFSIDETLPEEDMQVNLVNAEHEKILTEEYQHDQVDGDNLTLEFEDDEEIFDIIVKNFKGNCNKQLKCPNRVESYTAHGRNTSTSKDLHIASEIIETATVEIDSNQTDEIYRKKNILQSPKAVLREKTNREESYTAHGGNTNMSKSKIISKDLERSRSVSSNTPNKSLRLTAVIPDSIPMSPLPTRLSVLNNDTDIQIAEGQSWWKRLTVNSRRVTDMMKERENKDKAAEEFDVEILSQEKESMSLNSPESSDGESIHSIVLPQRELFKNRDNRPKKKLKEIINRKDSSGKMPKSFFEQTNIDKDINVMPKKLFNRAPKPETKSVFNAELFNASPNKTVKNSIENPAQKVEGPFRNIFGYRPSIKRKNIFAEFVSSDSDDEFSEIQPRIFGLRTKKNHQEASKQKRSSIYSSASNITDVEMGEWNHLPSSTMVEHQFEEASGTTPTKRLSKSRKSKDALNKNNSLNTSRRSSQVKYNSKIRPEFEEKNINTRSQSFNKSKNNSQVEPKSINSYVETNKTNSVRKSSQKNSSKLTHTFSIDETLPEEDMQVDLVNAEHEKILTEEYQHDQVDSDNLTLEFEDDEEIFDINVKNFEGNCKKQLKCPNREESYTAHGRNTSTSKDLHIASEIIETATVDIHSNQTDEIYRKKNILQSPEAVLCEKTNREESYTAHGRNTSTSKDLHIASKIIETATVEIHSNETDEIYRKKDILQSPEAVLREKTNKEESYTAHGGNTNMSKSKIISKDLDVQPSLGPARESSSFGSNSECSVWDSHRTTRQTLRQTFGKDFTPRKSLHTLVMKRAAKRKTNYNQNNQVADKSGFQTNADQSKLTTTSYSNIANKSKDKSTRRTSSNKNAHLNQTKRQTDFPTDRTDENPTRSNQEIDKNQKVESNEENIQNEESESDPKREEITKSVSAIDLQPNELVQNQTVESDKDIELYEKLDLEKDVSENEGIESDAESEQSEESESFNEQEQNVESELEQNEEVDSDAESEKSEESESFNEQEQNVESELEQNAAVESDGESEQNEESESSNEQEQNEESELEQNEAVECDGESEQNEESVSSNEQEQREEFESYRKPEPLDVEKMAEKAHDDAARQLRRANLEKYLQKVKEENAELRRKVQEKVLNSLKVKPKPFSVFKVPEIPKKQRTTKIIKKAPKPKLKSTILTNIDDLPAEFFEDLKYKPPKRFQGRNAPWITKRLYKFLEDKLQPKYDYRARVRAEKLVEKLYLFAKDVRKCARAAPQEAIWELKLEMARLGIVATHHEFYCFFHEFMPREIRIRVNPDILNKIPLPKNVFGNIMEE